MLNFKKTLKIIAIITITIIAIICFYKYALVPLKAVVKGMGIWAPIGIFFLRGISIIIPALPSSAYSLLAGSLLGFKTGYITIALADLVCCSSAFFIARRWGRAPVKKLVGKKAMQRIDGFSQNQLEGNFFLMTGMLMTGLFDFLSYAIGISRTRWNKFAPALLISVLISDAITVAAGKYGPQVITTWPFLAFLLIFGLAIFTGLRKKKETEPTV